MSTTVNKIFSRPFAILFILLFGFAFTSGCQNSSGPGNSPSKVPAQLSEELHAKILQKKPLPQEAMDHISTMFNAFGAKIPPTELIFETYKDPSQRSKALTRLDRSGHALLDRIKTNCTVTPETKSTTGELALNKTVSVETKKSVLGPSCPVAQSSSQIMSFKTTRKDDASRSADGSGTFEQSEGLMVLDESVQKLSLMVGYNFHTTGSIIFENISTSGSGMGNGALFATLNGTGQIAIYPKSQSSISLTMEMIQRTAQKSLQALIVIALPEGDLNVGVRSENSVDQYFINGEPYSKEQLGKFLGFDVTPITLD